MATNDLNMNSLLRNRWSLSRIKGGIFHRARKARTLPIRRRLGKLVRTLDDRGFAIVSNNCVAGQLYEMAAIAKQTPTAGLYFRGSAYPEFLDDLAKNDLSRWFPIDPSTLGIDRESSTPALTRGLESAIVFLHYPDAELAAEKWNSRVGRLRNRKLIVLASLRDGIESSMMDSARTRYDHFHFLSDAPTPPADEAILDKAILRRLARFLERVLERAE
jgi:uncharacterized protein (DUF1919 family)